MTTSTTPTTPWVVRMIEEQWHRDDEDRLIREGRTPERYIRAGEIEYKTCPYSGTRFQHAAPMNVSALRQMSAHWDDVLAALAVMRAAYTEQRGEQLPARPELMDLWRVGQLGSALPWFYLLRHGSDERPPAYAAALAKITLGVGLWAQRLLADLLAGTWTPPVLTPQAIYDLSESTGTLIGETEVCSGPEKMMIRFFEVLVAGTPEIATAATRSCGSVRTTRTSSSCCGSTSSPAGSCTQISPPRWARSTRSPRSCRR